MHRDEVIHAQAEVTSLSRASYHFCANSENAHAATAADAIEA
jgi:hypothetical protein